MNDKLRRNIVVRAFIQTGKDGDESLIRYIDQLERALLKLDRDIHDRRRTRDRIQVVTIVRELVNW